ncbi:hypothetical protein DM793_20955 [Paenarthrobacter nitroguajacolicus]|uniref:hypothetical protein n=1 Tax=Paenarthrobacter nitroguajacolicus TaxID=211146 RepID=UPI0015B7E841|nr:hypothetical protein [Paenarthrobacter nitroguajacolicus]NWL13736.1 hypothetical protein [Paenarthrobacter nitroguajacolicus]
MSPKTAPLTAVQVRADILAPVIEERARIKEGERAARAAIEEAQAKRNEEVSAWRAEAAECQRLFLPEPPPPARLEMPQHHALLHRAITARTRCEEWQNRLLAEHRGEVETAYRQALPDLTERTRATALGDADSVLGEWNGWLRLVRECRAAEERTGGRLMHDPPTSRMRTTITAADLLEAVNGADLLEPAPPGRDWIDGGPRDGFHQPMSGGPDGPDGMTREEAAQQRKPGGARWWI